VGTERERLEGVFARYRSSARKQRAWAADNPGNLAIRRELADAVLELAPEAFAGPAPLLDVGCGTGWWLAELAGRGAEPARLNGIELLEDRVQAATERVPGTKVVVGDARKLPYADGEFGLVTLFLVLSSMEREADVSVALREARRVVARGGILAVWEPRVPNPLNRATRVVSMRALRTALGEPLAIQSLTLFPPLARRCGPRSYARLARVRGLRTHRLVMWSGVRDR
jgi:ubiquinone/menaquinone biosynthesis C-methylase UbiE